jgi:nucleotide-binding universal stress UspA family protein
MDILYATEGSQGSLAAAQLLAHMPLTEDDRIHVATVRAGQSEAQAQARTQDALASLTASKAGIEVHTLEGAPADALLQAAREMNADLIALGAMGETGLLRFLVGSVAERVMRHSDRPVLLARPIRNDLKVATVAVDKSEISEAVMKEAAWLPLPPHTELRLITVLPSESALKSAAPLLWSGMAQELQQVMKQALTEAEEHLRTLGHMVQQTRRSVSAEVLRGDPSTSILAAADRVSADLIAVGSHGEGGVDRWLLGSVSERVARHAQCSVLVVHGEENAT